MRKLLGLAAVALIAAGCGGDPSVGPDARGSGALVLGRPTAVTASFPLPNVITSSGELLDPLASGAVAVGPAVWLSLAGVWMPNKFGDSYLMRIDSAGRERLFELPGCVIAGRPALWPGHHQLVVPCEGAFDANPDGMKSIGEVLLFDTATGEVAARWRSGSAEQVLVVGDRALVMESHTSGTFSDTDPGTTGPMVIDLARRRVVKGPLNEERVCLGQLASTGLTDPPAMILCDRSSGDLLVPIDLNGAPLRGAYSIPPGWGFALYSAVPEAYAHVDLQHRLELVSPHRVVPLAVPRPQYFDTAGGSIFETTVDGRVLRIRRGPEGLQADSTLIDLSLHGPYGLYAVSPNEVWLSMWDHVERVRFP